jgi:hypothetical protein
VYTWSPGIYAGITGDIRLGDKLKLETGFTYTQKGFQVSEKQNDTRFGQRLKLSYVEVPLLLKIIGQNEPGVSPFLVLGGSLSVGVLGQVYNKTSNNLNSDKRYFEMAFGTGYQAELNTFDGIINLGFGFIFQRFQFDVIYSHGLTNILTAKFDGEVLKTRTITIGASYWIKPKH